MSMEEEGSFFEENNSVNPDDSLNEEVTNESTKSSDENSKIGSEQFFDMITNDDLVCKAIIYDLIKTEQLDPWDIDLGILADKYLLIIQQMEEANFFVSSKVLLACSLLLRLKSEILVNSYIQDLNQILYGNKGEDKKYEIERIEIDENDLPILVPKTPMSRNKKVTLTQLMQALNQAIETESRRIKKEIKGRAAAKDVLTVLPRSSHIPLNVRIKSIFEIVRGHIKGEDESMEFSKLAPSKEEKLASFVPVLHLSNSKRIHLRQPVHFEEIHMSFKMHPEEIKALEQEIGFESGEEFPQGEEIIIEDVDLEETTQSSN